MNSFKILKATNKDKDKVLNLYKMQLGREYCPWNDYYPSEHEIDFDLSRDALFVMKDGNDCIIAAISIDEDENVENLDCWNPNLEPSKEISRLAVDIEHQNMGLARKMILYIMDLLKQNGYKGIHFLVNKHNIKALKSYSALQFGIVGECRLYEQDMLCYEKAL